MKLTGRCGGDDEGDKLYFSSSGDCRRGFGRYYETIAVAVCIITDVLVSYLTSVVSFTYITKAVTADLVTIVVVFPSLHDDVDVR